MTNFSSQNLLYRYSLLILAATLLLLAAGGLVTSHEAGLAVPDWPRSYGQWMPPMVGNIFWEHGHRMIAGTVGILTLLLTFLVQWKEKRSGVKKLAWAALAAVILQAFLGGLTVLMLLPAAVSVFHACLGQTFFCLLIALAFFLRPGTSDVFSPTSPPPQGGGGTRRGTTLFRLLMLTTAALYLQLILGALVRHTAKGLPYHVIWALVILGLIFFCVREVMISLPQRKGSVRAAAALGILTMAQFFLGIGAFIYTQILRGGSYAPPLVEVFFASAHQTNGAVVLGLSVLLTLMVRE